MHFFQLISFFGGEGRRGGSATYVSLIYQRHNLVQTCTSALLHLLLQMLAGIGFLYRFEILKSTTPHQHQQTPLIWKCVNH